MRAYKYSSNKGDDDVRHHPVLGRILGRDVRPDDALRASGTVCVNNCRIRTGRELRGFRRLFDALAEQL